MSSTQRPSFGTILSIAVILFAIFSFAGWLYETIENIFTFGGLYLRAELMLPWCPIYGIGGLVIVAVLEPLRKRMATRLPRPAELALSCVAIYVLTTAVELTGSYACEMIMGYVPWDYSDAWMNFDGRVAPAYTLRFVVLGLVALYMVFPRVRRWAYAHAHTAAKVSGVLVVLFVLDNVLNAMGIWAPIKDALVPFGINHW